MKLINKISISSFLITTMAFLLGGILFFYVLRDILDTEVKEKIMEKQYLVNMQVKKGQAPNNFPYIEVRELEEEKRIKNKWGIFKIPENKLFDYEDDDEAEEFLELKNVSKINGKYYQITIRESLIENEELASLIFFAFMLILISIVFAIIVVNYISSKKLFSPFYGNLEKLKSFSLQKSEIPKFTDTGINEFRELDSVINSLLQKIITDYNNIREFTENASHELQTPLGIIISKIELLIQGEDLDERQSDIVRAIYSSALRLSKLNKGLLLLSKIENRQFKADETIDFNAVAADVLRELQALYDSLEISVNVKSVSPAIAEMDRTLAEILIKNLIGNAIKHNIENGKIEITINSKSIVIANSGIKALGHPEKLFERFKKENQASDSLGLGLAIVKKICDIYNFRISYHFNDGKHYFTLEFTTSENL